jgi:hypothetical protein
VSEGNGSDGDAWLPAGSNHLGFEFGAVPTAPVTGVVYLFVSVHVSTYLEVDTILARPSLLFKMGWLNAYSIEKNIPSSPRKQTGFKNTHPSIFSTQNSLNPELQGVRCAPCFFLVSDN